MNQTLIRRVCPYPLVKRLFFLCCITYIIGAFGRLSYTAVMVELIAQGSMDKAQAGLIGTALFVAYGVFQLISGVIGDKISPKKMVFVGVFGSGVVNICMALFENYHMMLILWACNGIFQSFIWSPVARVFAEQLPPDQRKSACSNAAATFPIATVLSYFMASILLKFLNWQSVFYLSAAMMICASIVWWVRMSWFEQQIEQSDEIEVLEPQQSTQHKEKPQLLHLMIVSGVLFAAISSMAHGMLRDGIQTWLPSLMTENFHFGTSASVAMDIFLPMVNILGVVITKWIAKNYIRNELRGTVGFFGAAILVLMPLAFFCESSAALSLILLTTASTCMVGANVLLINLMPIHFGAVGRASSVTGVLNCAAYVGSAISSFGIGSVAQRAGWQAAIWMWVAFAGLALMTSLLDAKRWGRFVHVN